jgi:hypothetical protein
MAGQRDGSGPVHLAEYSTLRALWVALTGLGRTKMRLNLEALVYCLKFRQLFINQTFFKIITFSLHKSQTQYIPSSSCAEAQFRRNLKITFRSLFSIDI